MPFAMATPSSNGPQPLPTAATADFEMSYRPEVSVFPARWLDRAPSLALLMVAIAVAILVVVGENSPVSSSLFRYVVTEDVGRMVGARTFSILLGIASLASVVRANMKGVRVYADGLETREIRSFLIPRVRRYRWMQVECIVLDLKTTVALDLWDGRRAFLPVVANLPTLRRTLERIAAARAIPIRGGSGEHAGDAG